MKKLNQAGSHLIAVMLVIIVLAVVILAGSRVLKNSPKTESSQPKQTNVRNSAPAQKTAMVRWNYNDAAGKWASSSTPPACKEPFVFDKSPVDVTKATSILYPGQIRGGNYKPHGGFGFDGMGNDVAVVMPYDAYLVSGSRYIESGELQYLLDFVANCGVAIRFDHLLTLSPNVQAIVDKNFREAQVDDTKGNNIDTPVLFKSGETIATAIGHTKPSVNPGMDFGVYDYRKQNEASKDASYAAAHKDFSASTYYAVCWFDMLPAPDTATVKALPSRDFAMGKTSDYCK